MQSNSKKVRKEREIKEKTKNKKSVKPSGMWRSFTLEKFRCGIRWTTAKRIQFASWREFITESKVGNFDIHFTIQ